MISVTVVVPIYNKEAYIKSLVETINSQSKFPSEVIFIDDASTDNSLKILKSMDLGCNFRIIENRVNLGVSKSRNIGVSLSKNEIICLLDSDDYFEADYLCSMYKSMLKLNCDLLGSSYAFDVDGDVKTAKTIDCNVNEVRPVSLKDFYKVSLIYNLPFTCSSVFLNREKFLSLGGFPLGIAMGEDQVLWTKFLTEGRCYFMNKSKAYYRLNVDNSACDKKLPVGWLDYLPLLQRESSIYYDLYIMKLVFYHAIFIFDNRLNVDYKVITKLVSRWYVRIPLILGVKALRFFKKG
ncbi:glycosyltransferase family 2 protein [Vibrio renipiscarius]|uniref:Glycosyltransferase 2-like domain-containing protein n=1 Tax=Vibrio renipiscarius TaxID=1461322 RepID=A0A0C2KG58_9VIBR|nr:glycosyltransferase family 2 protein [Vibrio renipiscarius]KII81188.1 hypothetical protein OJ16_02760 [Vibrio renipiscarius]KII81605.1 hypothetical protein PL18_03285 [Vibrio renipiscarius]